MQNYRSFNSRPTRQQGFTLVELVIVIVLAGLIAVGSTLFIGQAVKGVTDTAERQKIAATSWIVSEKISRDLRRALPNSLRLGSSSGFTDNCIEFVPIVEGTFYRSIPVGVAESTAELFEFESYDAGQLASGDRLAVFPRDNIESYSLASPGPISSPMSSIAAGSLPGTVAVSFLSNTAFQDESPQNRVYVVREPLSYCFASGVLRMYRNYGFQSAFSSGALSNPVVVATGMRSGSFEYDTSSVNTNATVNILSSFELENGVAFEFNQEVQVRNVP